MTTITRSARALILTAAMFVVAGGESVVVPLAHLFDDHHHEIGFSATSGNWQWMAVADHHGYETAATLDRHGHDHEIRETPAPLRISRVSGNSLAVMAMAIHPNDAQRGSTFRTVPDLAPDIGKPDLALLATMRV